MGMSASQARFLQLTARKSNVEYQAQRINFERLQLAEKQAAVSQKYNDAISNTKLTFSFNTGEGVNTVDITYTNYKNYMNQQLEGLQTTQQKMFLVSSSGDKIIVSNEDEMKTIIENNKTQYSGTKEEILAAKEKCTKLEAEGKPISPKLKALASIELPEEEKVEETEALEDEEIIEEETEEAEETEEETAEEEAKKRYSIVVDNFAPSDFIIVPDLDDADNFQKALSEGIYFFATFGIHNDEENPRFQTSQLDSMTSVSKEYDKTDDAVAQSEYDAAMSQIQSKDKKLELALNQLNTERDAITTEMESVEKVLQDNIESSFKVFS